jgi:hypothetical protein
MRERTFALDELGDPGAPKGSKSWGLFVSNEIRKALYDSQRSSTSLRNMVEVFKEYEGWKALGVSSWETFCAKYYHKEAEEVEVTIKLREHGGDRKSEQYKNQFDNHQLDFRGKNKGGTDPRYLAARIARDRPDILEGMKQGKYKSVRAAAIDAGIIEPKQRYQLPTDATAAGRYLAGRVDNEWMIAFREAYMKAP